jgi:(4-(4-[2-(gamma-L-glutamylamino)ethyl]phenoxymethyl)furan-2-yl)methanamine synthase
MRMSIVLGLDIGGANLKAATSDGRCHSVPLAVWKSPLELAPRLKEIAGRFPEATQIAATMTAESCDCFADRRVGVAFVCSALSNATRLPVRIWTTHGRFVPLKAAQEDYLATAAANWLALATFAGQQVPKGRAVLVDMGTTTTDIVRLHSGTPRPRGLSDAARLKSKELYYRGWKRTGIAQGMANPANEYFASMQDLCLINGLSQDDPHDQDTADGRPATLRNARERYARMLGHDGDTIAAAHLARHAKAHLQHYARELSDRVPQAKTYVLSGSGEFLLRHLLKPRLRTANVISLNDTLGPALSAVAPAYAVAMLARIA